MIYCSVTVQESRYRHKVLVSIHLHSLSCEAQTKLILRKQANENTNHSYGH